MANRVSNRCKEGCVNWLSEDDLVSVTVFEKKFNNQIEKLVDAHPDEVRIVAVNEDGTMVAHLLKKYVHVNFSERAKREMTEDQKAAAAERMRAMRQKKAEKNE